MSEEPLKRILFILHFPPPVHGAAMVGQYIKDSEVINSSFSCNFINLSTSSKIDEIGKNSWSKWQRFFSILFEVFKVIKNDRPDLVYFTLTANGLGFFKDAILVFIVKLFRLNIVYHFHNKGVSFSQNKWIYNVFYKRVFNKAWIILLAPQLYQDVKKYVPQDRVFYCPNGIPEQSNILNNRRSLKGPAQILFLSNLIESKGIYVLLDACKILSTNQIPFQCNFVGGEGDISVSQFQKKIVEFNLQDEVFYLGKKYGEDKELIYSQADIFSLPTFYSKECFPLVILEAMQHGLPVIATPEGGIESLIKEGETGFLVGQNNAEELASKLEYLIKNSDLRNEIGVNGRDYFLKEFTLVKFERNFVEILNRIS